MRLDLDHPGASFLLINIKTLYKDFKRGNMHEPTQDLENIKLGIIAIVFCTAIGMTALLFLRIFDCIDF
jgi:hypothetical protein